MTQKKNKKTKAGVNKNSYTQLNHSISKIKSNERKYTIILTTIFVAIFALIGYSSLKVDSTTLLNSINNQDIYRGISTSGRTITLTNDNIMSDVDGLNSENYVIKINNDSYNSYNYKILLSEDEFAKKQCECTNNISQENIKYSIDGKTINSFNSEEDLVILKDYIEKGNEQTIKLKIWLSDQMDKKENYHMHAKVVLVEDKDV